MADDLPPFECSWGSLRLFAQEISTDVGRTKVVHDLSSGDVHPSQDMGRHSRRTKLRLLFDNVAGFPPPAAAAKAFEAAVDTGESALFTHPMLGSYMAGIGDYTQIIDEHGVITADIEMIREDEAPAVTPAGASTTGVSGELAVNAAADELDAAMEEKFIPSERDAIMSDDAGLSVTDDARNTVSAWNAGDVEVNTRQVLIDVSRLSERIELAIQVGQLEDELTLWRCYVASIMLGAAVRAAGIAATSEVASVFVMRVIAPTALLPLAARVYGGAEAEDRARQISSLNDISTPGWLAPGDYVMPARSSASRSPF
jgi:hypothetical protein